MILSGIKSNSILNDLSAYHVCNPGLAPCLAHDILEGGPAIDVMLSLNELVKKKMFTFEYLNEKLKNVRFILENKITFPALKKSTKLTGTASENLYVINALPFALHEMHEILFTIEEWHLILLIRKVVNFAMSFKLSIDQIAVFQSTISEYINLRLKLFPTEKLKPKHHYISHYPYLTKCFGPLRHLMTLVFERKHRYFTTCMKHSPNFKNVLKMLSLKHQLHQAAISINSTLIDTAIADDSQEFDINNYSEELNLELSRICNINNLMLVADVITFHNIMYKKGMHVCTEIDEFGYIHLCRIKHFFIHNDMEKIILYGDRIKIVYNEASGLYHEISENEQNQTQICKYFDEIINVEPVMCSKISIENDVQVIYYLKSAPFQL